MNQNTKTLLIVGGIGIVAYLWYKQSQPAMPAQYPQQQLPPPPPPPPGSTVGSDIQNVLADFGVGVPAAQY